MRKIDDKLIDRMTKGDLAPLLKHIKSDNELRLEVRQNGEAFVYYRKGKALEIRSLKADKKYGNIPDTKLAVSNPSEYFSQMKSAIDAWLEKNKKRAEFDTQQNIARFNQNRNDRYLILDMEYAFEQNNIPKEDREKRAVFDLLGIEKETNRIIFFELKKGMSATEGKSGIEEHINDFNTYLFGKNSKKFRTNLIKDIKNIVEDKIKLGILDKINIPDDIDKKDPELVFILHPDDISQVKKLEKMLNRRHKLIVVDNKSYKLK